MIIESMLGLTFVIVHKDDESLTFVTDSGQKFHFSHSQDCCESVYIESVVGDLNDLLDSPMLVAEESTSDENPPDYKGSEYQDCFEWTFYKFATRKGYVDVRWYGESNGYYSTSVGLHVSSSES